MEKFTPKNAAILLVDHQDMTVSWIYSQNQKTVINNVRMFARLGTEMNIPLLITSTMEDNIGTNIKDIQETAPIAYANRVKRGGTLCCFDDENFKTRTRALDRKNLMIAGLTTDICLYHTVIGALKEGYNVQVIADACGSSSILSDQVTFDRLRSLGVIITGANMALTELYTDFGSPEGQMAMKINLEEVVSKMGK
jgi:nicotinamidase-related amidase